jgi:hypothetical protein
MGDGLVSQPFQSVQTDQLRCLPIGLVGSGIMLTNFQPALRNGGGNVRHPQFIALGFPGRQGALTDELPFVLNQYGHDAHGERIGIGTITGHEVNLGIAQRENEGNISTEPIKLGDQQSGLVLFGSWGRLARLPDSTSIKSVRSSSSALRKRLTMSCWAASPRPLLLWPTVETRYYGTYFVVLA